MKRLVPLLLLFLPIITQASVTISEVAWMGSATSANYEWIELYNDGQGEVSVDGWSLSDGQNFNVTLKGKIVGGNFAVLERTSEESAPGTAFLLYTGALVNTGATLVLKDQNGSVVDQVAGGENWEKIGGDNTTKDTAQYSGSKWVTDKPTPGKVNGTGGTATVSTNASSTKSTGTLKKTAGGTNVLAQNEEDKEQDFRIDATTYGIEPHIPTTGHVNQLLGFNVEMVGQQKNFKRNARYHWNFGDSFTSTQKNPTHTYQFAGEYVVTVSVYHLNDVEISRQEITILPVTLTLGLSLTGDWQINNNAPYDVDLSAYVLRGEKSVLLPKETIIAPNGTITIAKERLGQGVKKVELLDFTETVVASRDLLNENAIADKDQAYVPVATAWIPKVDTLVTSRVPDLSKEKVDEKTLLEKEKVIPSFGQVDITKQLAQVPNNTEKNTNWPFWTFFVVLVLALVSVMYPLKDKVSDKEGN